MNLYKVFEDLCTAIEKNQTTEGYTKDGLIYCEECHTPKQKRVVIGGQEYSMPCSCKCVSEMIAEKERIREEIERQETIRDMRKEAFPVAEMMEWNFDNAEDTESIRFGKRYVENFDDINDGLMLYGSVGTGKSYLAACICNALIDKGTRCLMATIPSLVERLKGEDIYDYLRRYKLIVLDDLAMERDTEYMSEQISQIIDARWISKLPTIVTTNLTADEIRNPATITKRRAYSRLWDMCFPVEVKGKDHRRTGFAERHKGVRELYETGAK